MGLNSFRWTRDAFEEWFMSVSHGSTTLQCTRFVFPKVKELAQGKAAQKQLEKAAGAEILTVS